MDHRRLAFVAATVAAAIVLAPAAAHADVVTPAGACAASGHWVGSGQTERSADHSSSDVITVPRSDTVEWAGNIKGYALGATGPRRPISGEVQLDLPIGSVTIDDWGKDSERYANEGEHDYDLPSVLAGVKMKLHGEHREDGNVVCAGSVYVKIKGTSPLLFVSIALLLASAWLLYLAGRPNFRKRRAFEDVNPG